MILRHFVILSVKGSEKNSTMQVQGVLQRASNRFISVLLNKLCLCLHNDWNWPLGLEKLEAIQAKLSAKNMLCGNRVCQEMASRKMAIREASPINQKAGGSLTNHMENNIGLSGKTSKPWFPRIKTWGYPIQNDNKVGWTLLYTAFLGLAAISISVTFKNLFQQLALCSILPSKLGVSTLSHFDPCFMTWLRWLQYQVC